MKYSNCIILCILCLPLSLAAQGKASSERRIAPAIKPTVKVKRFEIGFNTTPLIKQVLNLSGNNLAQSPYDFTFRYYFKNNSLAYRFGTGLRYREHKDIDITSGGATGSETRFKDELYAFRNGIELIKPINKHLRAHLGADFIYSYKFNGSSNQFNEITDKTTEYGGGLVLGLSPDLSKSFSLYTETSMYVATAKTKTSNERKNRVPPSKTSTEGTTKTLTSTLPTTLYLTFKF